LAGPCSQDADFCFFAFDDATKIADVGGVERAGFDGQDDLLGLPAFFVVEVEASVEPWSAPFFFSSGRAPTRLSAHHWN
jgi:hypothetical protein